MKDKEIKLRRAGQCACHLGALCISEEDVYENYPGNVRGVLPKNTQLECARERGGVSECR